MKTTLEIDDALYREAKAVAALAGRKIKDLVSEGLAQVVRREKRLAFPVGSGTILPLASEGADDAVPLVCAEDVAAYGDTETLRKAFPRGYRLSGALIPAKALSRPLSAARVREGLETMDQEELDAHARPG